MIHPGMTIEEVIRKYPATIPVFKKFGLNCMDCQIAEFEAVEHGAGVHQVDLAVLLTELNRAIGR